MIRGERRGVFALVLVILVGFTGTGAAATTTQELLSFLGERRPGHGMLGGQPEDGRFDPGPVVNLDLLRRPDFHRVIRRIEENAEAGGGPDALRDLGVLRLAQGRSAEAVEAFDRAVLLDRSLAGDDLGLRNDLGVALLERGLAEESVLDLLDALELFAEASEEVGASRLVRRVDFNRSLARSALGLDPFRGSSLGAEERQDVARLVPPRGRTVEIREWSLPELVLLTADPEFVATEQEAVRRSLWAELERRALEGLDPLVPAEAPGVLDRLSRFTGDRLLEDLVSRWSREDAAGRGEIGADVAAVMEAVRLAEASDCAGVRRFERQRLPGLVQAGSMLQWLGRLAVLECDYAADAVAARGGVRVLLDEIPEGYVAERVEALRLQVETLIRNARLSEADEAAAQLLGLIEEHDAVYGVESLLLHLVGLWSLQGRVEEVGRAWWQILGARSGAFGWARVRAVLAGFARDRGRFLAAREILLDSRGRAPVPAFVWESDIQLAGVELELGQRSAAEERLRRALSELRSPGARSGLTEELVSQFEIRILELLLAGELPPPDERRVLAGRLRHLVEAAGRGDKMHVLALAELSLGGSDDERRGAVDALLGRWEAAGTTLEDLGGVDGTDWEIVLRSALDLVAPADAAAGAGLAYLFQEQRRGFGPGRVRTPTELADRIGQVGGRLAGDTAVLISAWGGERLWTFLLTREGTDARLSAARRPEVEEAVSDLQRSLARQDDAVLIRSLGSTVMGHLLGAGGLPEGTTRLHVVPAAGLDTVPLGALWDADGKRYLVEKVAWSWLGTLGEAGPGPTDGSPEEVLIVAGRDFGDAAEPLPHAEAEAEAIAELVDRPVLLLGSSAGLGAVRRHLPEAARVHLAVHARSSGGRGVVVLPSSADGLAAEVGLEELLQGQRKDLVFLSACGLTGQLVDGRRSRASLLDLLVQDVADHLVWTDRPVVDERAHELAVAFYSGLAAGAEPAVALARAQRSLLARGVPPSGWGSHHLTQISPDLRP